MTDYFKRVFGAEEIYREEHFHGAPNAVMRLGSARFFLRGVRPEETSGAADPDMAIGLDHFSLAVDDTHTAVAELKGRGAEFIREPGSSCMGGRTTVFIRDPEDIRIELSERAGDTYTV
jgi:catechol 2,3-dioxygenase-like lactoylglutathione lyase family enzyme